MKLSAFISFSRPGATTSVFLLLIGWMEVVVGHPLHEPLSPPLQNEEMYKIVDKVAKNVSVQFNQLFQMYLEFKGWL